MCPHALHLWDYLRHALQTRTHAPFVAGVAAMRMVCLPNRATERATTGVAEASIDICMRCSEDALCERGRRAGRQNAGTNVVLYWCVRAAPPARASFNGSVRLSRDYNPACVSDPHEQESLKQVQNNDSLQRHPSPTNSQSK